MILSRGGFELNEIWSRQVVSLQEAEDHPEAHKDVARELLQQSGSLSKALAATSRRPDAKLFHRKHGSLRSGDIHKVLQSWSPSPHKDSDEHITVYTATDKDTAALWKREGVVPQLKTRNLARQRYERGEKAEFAPGRGLSGGVYVGHTPKAVESYGRKTVALRVHPSSLQIPPESEQHSKTPQEALRSQDGAVIHHAVHPDAVQHV